MLPFIASYITTRQLLRTFSVNSPSSVEIIFQSDLRSLSCTKATSNVTEEASY